MRLRMKMQFVESEIFLYTIQIRMLYENELEMTFNPARRNYCIQI